MNDITLQAQSRVDVRTKLICYLSLFMTMLLLGSIQTTKGMVLSQVQADIDISMTMIGTLLSIFQLGFTGAAMVTGYLTDKKGIRIMMLSGSGLMVMGLVGTGLAGSALFFLGFYAVIGLGIGSMLTAICSVIPKVFPEKASTLFNVGNAMFGVGLIAAPLALNYISANDQTWRLFYFSITAIVVVIMVMMATIELEKLEESDRLTVADAVTVLKDKKVLLLLSFFTFYVAMEASFFNFFPLFMQNADIAGMTLEEKTAGAGKILASFGFVFTICRFLGGMITTKLGESNTLVLFSLISCISLILGTMYVENATILFGIFGFGLSLLWTTAQTIICRGTNKEGTVIGLTYMAAGLGGTVSGMLIGTVSDSFGVDAGFGVIAIFGLITLTLALITKKVIDR
ncbi:MFS transporter [Vibrio cionasavignyae]|uniref:MFS transporter n=1 Tax=Vibrio cionasavignyae TaxID=2910252 RepID=UPI003D0AE6A7